MANYGRGKGSFLQTQARNRARGRARRRAQRRARRETVAKEEAQAVDSAAELARRQSLEYRFPQMPNELLGNNALVEDTRYGKSGGGMGGMMGVGGGTSGLGLGFGMGESDDDDDDSDDDDSDDDDMRTPAPVGGWHVYSHPCVQSDEDGPPEYVTLPRRSSLYLGLAGSLKWLLLLLCVAFLNVCAAAPAQETRALVDEHSSGERGADVTDSGGALFGNMMAFSLGVFVVLFALRCWPAMFGPLTSLSSSGSSDGDELADDDELELELEQQSVNMHSPVKHRQSSLFADPIGGGKSMFTDSDSFPKRSRVRMGRRIGTKRGDQSPDDSDDGYQPPMDEDDGPPRDDGGGIFCQQGSVDERSSDGTLSPEYLARRKKEEAEVRLRHENNCKDFPIFQSSLRVGSGGESSGPKCSACEALATIRCMSCDQGATFFCGTECFNDCHWGGSGGTHIANNFDFNGGFRGSLVRDELVSSSVISHCGACTSKIDANEEVTYRKVELHGLGGSDSHRFGTWTCGGCGFVNGKDPLQYDCQAASNDVYFARPLLTLLLSLREATQHKLTTEAMNTGLRLYAQSFDIKARSDTGRHANSRAPLLQVALRLEMALMIEMMTAHDLLGNVSNELCLNACAICTAPRPRREGDNGEMQTFHSASIDGVWKLTQLKNAGLGHGRPLISGGIFSRLRWDEITREYHDDEMASFLSWLSKTSPGAARLSAPGRDGSEGRGCSELRSLQAVKTNASKVLRVNAVFAAACPHNILIPDSGAMIRTPGEAHCYAHLTMRRLARHALPLPEVFGAATPLAEHQPTPLFITSDVVCSLMTYLRKRDPNFAEWVGIKLCLGLVHMFAHLCQRYYGGVHFDDFACRTGENIETLWSKHVPAEQRLKHLGESVWIEDMRYMFTIETLKSIDRLAEDLANKRDNAAKRHRAAQDKVLELKRDAIYESALSGLDTATYLNWKIELGVGPRSNMESNDQMPPKLRLVGELLRLPALEDMVSHAEAALGQGVDFESGKFQKMLRAARANIKRLQGVAKLDDNFSPSEAETVAYRSARLTEVLREIAQKRADLRLKYDGVTRGHLKVRNTNEAKQKTRRQIKKMQLELGKLQAEESKLKSLGAVISEPPSNMRLSSEKKLAIVDSADRVRRAVEERLLLEKERTDGLAVCESQCARLISTANALENGARVPDAGTTATGRVRDHGLSLQLREIAAVRQRVANGLRNLQLGPELPPLFFGNSNGYTPPPPKRPRMGGLGGGEGDLPAAILGSTAIPWAAQTTMLHLHDLLHPPELTDENVELPVRPSNPALEAMLSGMPTHTPLFLPNLGNSCFVNSAVQCLAAIPAVRTIVRQIASPLQCTTFYEKLLLNLQKFFECVEAPLCILDALEGEEGDTVDLKAIGDLFRAPLSVVEEERRRFNVGYKQEDTSEFLISLLDCLTANDDLKKMDLLFNSSYVTTTTCKEDHVFTKLAPRQGRRTLSLALTPEATKLEELLANEFAFVELTGDNEYFCTKCGKRSEAKRETFIVQPAPVLIFILKRFRSGAQAIKVGQAIAYPKYLDLGSTVLGYTEDAGTHGYRLAGVQAHQGNAGGGHYFSYVCLPNGQWWVVNCSETGPTHGECTEAAALGEVKDGYVFFYVHCTPSDGSG